MRLLKHGESGWPDYTKPCPSTGEAVADADILAWAVLNVKSATVAVNHNRADRVNLERMLANARETEARSEAELKAAQEILAEYQAKAGGQ
jgi:phage terminase large subunit-like protein